TCSRSRARSSRSRGSRGTGSCGTCRREPPATKEAHMPKTTKSGKVRQEELPDTLKRSSAKAQRTFAKAHDAAVEQYGEGERAHRTAFAALKHSFEKVGDRWVAKKEKGPSDPRSKKT